MNNPHFYFHPVEGREFYNQRQYSNESGLSLHLPQAYLTEMFAKHDAEVAEATCGEHDPYVDFYV